jgi:hypothetical protein
MFVDANILDLEFDFDTLNNFLLPVAELKLDKSQTGRTELLFTEEAVARYSEVSRCFMD